MLYPAELRVHRAKAGAFGLPAIAMAMASVNRITEP